MYNSGPRLRFFIGLGMAISISALSPVAVRAQQCSGTVQHGCTNGGAACKIASTGKAGVCTTGGNFGKLNCSCQEPIQTGGGGPAVKAFDVVTVTTDANGFPLNPQWGQQNPLPTPSESCPVDSTQTDDWLSAPDCTSYPVTFNGASGFVCGHHSNFMTVTYDGTVSWESGPAWVGDIDYSLNVARPDSALYSTSSDSAHIEFDARETVNNWDGTGTWWEKFHHAVDAGDEHASAMINGDPVMVIGLLGLDSPHGSKTELHPVYAMFVQVSRNTKLNQTTWAFFVRNWGNEGFCDGDQENLSVNSIKILIPSATKPLAHNMWDGARNTDDTSGMSVSSQPQGRRDLLLNFNLLSADKQSWFMGDLTVQDAPPVVDTAVGEDDALFGALQEQVEKLPKASQDELRALQSKAIATKPGRQVQLKVLEQTAQAAGNGRTRPGTVVGASDLVRPVKDTEEAAALQKKLEVLKKYFADKGVKVDVPATPK